MSVFHSECGTSKYIHFNFNCEKTLNCFPPVLKTEVNFTLEFLILWRQILTFYFPVVYEHRSRLEKSLQKERLEHKKAKEGKYIILFVSCIFIILFFEA